MNTHARDRKRADATISDVRAHAFSIPTDAPEGDGTFRWDRTTLVVVEIEAADVVGLGYSYTSAAAAPMILQTLAPIARGADAFDVQRLWCALQRAVRNIGRDGLAATAISAVDTAAWDLCRQARGSRRRMGRSFGVTRACRT